MSGLYTKVSKNLPIEDGYMRYRDGSLTFKGPFAGKKISVVGMLMENEGHDMHAKLYLFIILWNMKPYVLISDMRIGSP